MLDANLTGYVLQFGLALICGALVKVVDYLDDELKSKNPIKFVLAIFYGIIIGFLIGNSSFALIFVAAVIAQVLALKVDTWSHRIGVFASCITLLAFSLPTMDWSLFILFTVAAFLDEVEFIGRLNFLTRYRLFLIIASVIALLLTSNFDYFIAIVLFDLAYIGVNEIMLKLFKSDETSHQLDKKAVTKNSRRKKYKR